ncbi:SusC/RagA family TonB-linked outer membrane protein [uncultured Porphyromonas sp.]|uniref:SusC/RagA family TonB-linked outer membrane protein n=1 Tax=uncultured Porphyromonas sp. TaxID=159274 RepID=UPI0026132257|nr:SusC/RagA family TonB-linked outer membrane protein [uncultured Porphyromonas sp.]
MKSKILMLISLCLLTVGTALGQTITVKGIVTDERGDGVIGATVRLKSDASVGTQTGIDGDFTLKAKQGEIIIVSYVGYKTQEVAAAPNLTIKLHPDTELLDDVVVVAYGTAKKQSLVGAQANVSAKQLENRPITNVSSALGSVAPGVQVTTATGQPGSSAGIMIRGFGSINASSAPLYVVDGSIYNGNIADISPSDIQSISLLKDAASTALYGSSAGNGVILITTKSGSRAGSKPTVSFTMNIGGSRNGLERYETVDARDYTRLLWRQFYNTHLYQNKFSEEQAWLKANADAYDDMGINDMGQSYFPFAGIKTSVGIDANSIKPNPRGGLLFDLTTGPNGSFDDVFIPLFNAKDNLYMSPLMVNKDGTLNSEITGMLWADDQDWEKAVYRTGLRQEYVVNSGYNTDALSSFLSLSYLTEQGYKKFTDFGRFSARANIAYNVTDWMKIGTNISFSETNVEQPKSAQGKGFYSDPFYFLSAISPIYPIHMHKEDGSYILDEKGNKVFDYSDSRRYSSRFNPALEQTLDKNTTKRDNLTSRQFVELKLYEGLTFRSNYAFDLRQFTQKTRYNNVMGDQPQGLLTMSRYRQSTKSFNQLLEYTKDFGDHNINLLLGHESYDYTSEYSGAGKENMFLNGLDEFDNLVKMSYIESNTDNYRKEGYFGRINYAYADRYNVSLSYRRDGSSSFAPDRRWGNFWSVGAGWNISNEAFMASAKDWLDFFKLRVSIGQTGNDNGIGYYAYRNLYSTSNNFESLGTRVATIGNKDLRWEKQTSFDVAFEFSLFKRFMGTIELFNKESDDLIFAFPLPLSTGISSIDKNLGKVRNYGVEMDFKVNLINSNDFRWDINANGTFFKNLIVRLPEENREKGIELDYNKYMEGKSTKDFYLNEFIGVDPDNGRAIYRIDSEKYPDQADPKNENFAGIDKEGERAQYTYNSDYAAKHYCGSSIPTLYGGFGTSLAWKGVDFNILFGYQLGGKVYDYGYASLMSTKALNAGKTWHKDMLNAWQKPGQKTDLPGQFSGSYSDYNNARSDRFLTSASALMLKSVSIGYNLPKEWVSKMYINNMRVSIAGENLFLVSARKGLNPMGSYSGVADNSSFGFARTVTASLTMSF